MDEIERDGCTPDASGRWRCRARRGMGAAAAALAATSLLAASGSTAHAKDTTDSTAAARPSPLALQLEMAARNRFYLEVDGSGGAMRLKLDGVTLRAYPLLGLEHGTPRLAFFTLGDNAGAPDGIHPVGSIDPLRPEVRLEIQPPDPNAPDSTLPVFQPPPSIEEMSVPWNYSIRFEDGLTLAVTSPREMAATGFKALAGAVRDKFADCREAVAVRRPHLRVVLERADAQHLYRSLPPETDCLVLGP